MALALDHVFICTDDPRRAEQALIDFGLEIGRRMVHEGQGTANACAFFDNAYLELLWTHDESELRSEVVRPLGLWERIHWAQTGATPFGIACRTEGDALPVDAWAYAAPFLPPGAAIPIVTPRFSWHEPLVFLMPESRAPATWPEHVRPPLAQRGLHRTLTSVSVHGPQSEISSGVRILCDLGLLAIESGTEHRLELVWDRAAERQAHDFRPTLPLVLRW